MEAYIFIAVFVILLLLQTPVPVAVGISAVLGLYMNDMMPLTTVYGTFNGLNSFTLLAVPFFIFAGNIMSRGNIAQELLNVARVFAGGKRTAVGAACIVACAFFAALSGSAVITVAALGAMTIPMMTEQGYSPAYACAITASGAIVGPIIPPSLSMVVYGVATSTSISDLFIAGLLPGILMSFSFYITLMLTHRRAGNIDYDKPVPGMDHYTAKEKLKAIWKGKWALLMPIIVLGGIYGGFVTPTEAAVIACDYALIISLFVTREMKLPDLAQALRDTLVSTGSVMVLVGASNAFGQSLTLNMIPTKFSGAVLGLSSNPIIVLLLIVIILMIVGCFMEGNSAIVILTPILLPLAQSCGLSKIEFGVVICVGMVIGTITPPFGMDLFMSASIGKVPFVDVVRKTVPFLAASIIVLLLITYVPQISSFLPNLLAQLKR